MEPRAGVRPSDEDHLLELFGDPEREVIGLGLLLVGAAVDVLDASALEAGDEACQTEHVEDLIFEAAPRRFPKEKESAPGVEGAFVGVDGFGRINDTDLGGLLGSCIAGEHSHTP